MQHTQPQSAARVLARCEQLGVHIATWDDEEYPASLRLMEDPPPVVYYKGDISVLQPDVFTFAIIGARRPSAYGLGPPRPLPRAWPRRAWCWCPAWQAALTARPKGRCARGHAHGGLHCVRARLVLPAANRTLKGLIEKQGLVLGEYPPGTEPLRPPTFCSATG